MTSACKIIPKSQTAVTISQNQGPWGALLGTGDLKIVEIYDESDVQEVSNPMMLTDDDENVSLRKNFPPYFLS